MNEELFKTIISNAEAIIKAELELNKVKENSPKEPAPPSVFFSYQDVINYELSLKQYDIDRQKYFINYNNAIDLVNTSKDAFKASVPDIYLNIYFRVKIENEFMYITKYNQGDIKIYTEKQFKSYFTAVKFPEDKTK